MVLAVVITMVLAVIPPTSSRRAVIVDQLSLTAPNPDFVAEARRLMEASGYTVDHYDGTEVDVALIRDLPLRDYTLILLRAHSARIETAEGQSDDVSLFTGEMIDLQNYSVSGVPPSSATAVMDALRLQAQVGDLGGARPTYAPAETANLIPVFYDPEGGELPFFGVRPTFIEENMAGNLPDSTVILMGCDGLRSPRMAEAFFRRGVSRFVSWDQPVTAEHTDRATELLLRRHLVENLDLDLAVQQINAELGPDPNYGGVLVSRSRQD